MHGFAAGQFGWGIGWGIGLELDLDFAVGATPSTPEQIASASHYASIGLARSLTGFCTPNTRKT